MKILLKPDALSEVILLVASALVFVIVGFVMKAWRKRLPLIWFAFYLLFGFWLASYFLHLRGGLTTFSIAILSIVLFGKTVRAKRASRSGGPRPGASPGQTAR